jgi:hypothetical protein
MAVLIELSSHETPTISRGIHGYLCTELWQGPFAGELKAIVILLCNEYPHQIFLQKE